MSAEATCKPKGKHITWKKFIIDLVFIFALIPISIVGISEWAHTVRHEEECELKSRLVADGRSAEEIQQIVYGPRYGYHYTSSRASSRSSSRYEADQTKIEAEFLRYLRSEGFTEAEVIRLHTVTLGDRGTVQSSSAVRRIRNAVAATKTLVQRGLSADQIERALTKVDERDNAVGRAIQEKLRLEGKKKK